MNRFHSLRYIMLLLSLALIVHGTALSDVSYAGLLESDSSKASFSASIGEERPFDSAPKGAWRFFANRWVSGILIVIGCIGLILELVLPGITGLGLLGAVSFILFFGARLATGTAGWEVVILFVGGVLLLIIEGFVFPGVGIPGIAGLIMVMIGIQRAFVDTVQAVLWMSIAVFLSAVTAFIAIKYVGRSAAWQRITLGHKQLRNEGYVTGPSLSELEGATGIAVTVLRPVGTGEFNGRRIDVVTQGEFIEPGTRLEVVSINGSRVVVKPIDI